MPRGYISIADHRAVVEELQNKIDELKSKSEITRLQSLLKTAAEANDIITKQYVTAREDADNYREDVLKAEHKHEKAEETIRIIKDIIDLGRM